MDQLRFKALWLAIGIMMVTFVVYASLTPSPVAPGMSLSDKALHIIAYFVLMGWFIQIYQQRGTRALLGLLFIAMGVGLEFLQDYGGVRQFELLDMLANCTGVLLAWLLVLTPFPGLLFRLEGRLVSELQADP